MSELQKQFLKSFKIISHITQSMLLVLLQGCFKKTGIPFKGNNVLRNEDEEY